MALGFDFREKDNTLPLPATLVKALGESMAKEHPGTAVRLMSRFPFPNRAAEARLDAFQSQALAALEQDPKTPVHSVEQVDGRLSVRYAVADVMKDGCVACHNGPYFSDQQFHNVGLTPGGVGAAGRTYDFNDHGAAEGLALLLDDPLNTQGIYSDGDDGRVPKSVPESLDGAFRTPSLRCSSTRPSFMHTGHMHSLSDVVAFFARGGDETGFEGKSVNFDRGLSEQDQADLVEFIKTLDGPGPSAELLKPPVDP